MASGLFVAVGAGLDTSEDGATWTARASSTAPFFYAVGYGGGRWLALSNDGTHASDDLGVTWTRVSSSPTFTSGRVAYHNGTWVAVNNAGTVYDSDDGGATWTQVGALPFTTCLDLHSGGSALIAASGNSPGLARSVDGGVTWTDVTPPGLTELVRAIARSDSGRWVATGNEFNEGCYSDDDGATWAIFNPGFTFRRVDGVTFGGGRFVAAGRDANGDAFAAWSSDGLSWTQSSPGGDDSGSASVAYAAGVFAGFWADPPRARSIDGGQTWTTGSSIGNVLAVHGADINTAPNAPLVTDQGPFDRTAVNRVTWTFSDPDAGDSQSAAELRYREAGTSTWTTVNIGNPNQFWDAPAGTFVADLYEAQVKAADQAGEWGPFSASFFITAADAPPGPTWLDPINGQTIGQSSYTGSISAPDVDESEWTLYADNAGAIDTGTVIQGPIVKTVGDLRSHTFTGLANNVTVWWSVRVKHDGLWSQPAQIRTPVSYTPPPTPVVTYAHVAAEGAVDVTVTNPAPGTGEPAVSYNDVFIRDPGEDWERRATNVAPNGTWRYHRPVSGWDPAANIKVTAVGDNSTTVTTEGASEA